MDSEISRGFLCVDFVGSITDIRPRHEWHNIGEGQSTHHLAITRTIHNLNTRHLTGHFCWANTRNKDKPHDGGSGKTFSHTCEGSTSREHHKLVHGTRGDTGTN